MQTARWASVGNDRGCAVMEHRCGVRRPVQKVVVLCGPGREVRRAVLRNVSISGAFIELHNHRWRTFTTIEVRTSGPEGDGAPTCVAVAMIVRVTQDGVGVLFDIPNPTIIAALVLPHRQTVGGVN